MGYICTEMNEDLYRIESYTCQSLNGGAIWFTGTKEECEKVLPRIKSWAQKLPDEFKIVKADTPSDKPHV